MGRGCSPLYTSSEEESSIKNSTLNGNVTVLRVGAFQGRRESLEISPTVSVLSILGAKVCVGVRY
jgi:hypothetical protein